MGIDDVLHQRNLIVTTDICFMGKLVLVLFVLQKLKVETFVHSQNYLFG